MKVLVIYGSSREEGNTELLTEKVVEGLDCTRIYLRHQNVQPVVDKRHAPEGFQPVDDDHDAIIRQLLEHDLVIFATPLYWYGMSGPMKDFVDRWSQSLRDPRFDFRNRVKGKRAWVVITGGADARLKGLPLILQFGHIFDFVGMEFAGYLIGTGGKPGQVLQDERVLLEAGWVNKHLHGLA
ncbi:MAG: flavodoxin family protein [Bacillota bacterium]